MRSILRWFRRSSVSALHAALQRPAVRAKLADPEAPETREIKDLMDAIDEAELNLDAACALMREAQVAYVPVVETDEFHICLFLLAPHASIPLHDHPGMTVLSRVLRGSMRVTSYDRVSYGHVTRHEPVTIAAPARTVALFPHLRNIHEFVALERGVAILDVIVPPYDDDRPCTYYDVYDDTPVSGKDANAVRRVVSVPEPDFSCVHVPYFGLPP
ncbi:hypothetical protein CTAYLR_010578 [Chrysophaeum taylorii]|uniref:Uncharacterized protein n=1 Tax=Chrysophaeum taylorii TaxID=2483200 RepID=A0AAD7U864_9STRA|nr:hypothetical protein CTAYLR_010578 [Chrysophaeum taylorii]